jgi:hypothetical protein
MTRTGLPASGAPPAGTAGHHLGSWLIGGTAGCAALGFLVAVTWGRGALLALGVLLAGGLFLAAACRPVVATYVYLGSLPILAGIDRGTVLPLVRPNEAVLVVLLAGAGLGGYLRYCRGDPIPVRPHRLDVPLAGFLLMSTVWPVTSLLLRGHVPAATDLAAVLPVCKLVVIHLLVRCTVATAEQLVRCIRMIVWPGALVALVAVLQTLGIGPVLWALAALWTPDAAAAQLAERGTTTLSSPIATGDYVIFSLVLVICCGARGVLDRRERLVLGLVLATGALAAGQFSTWISAAVAAGLLLWRFPELRGRAGHLLPVLPVVFALGAPAFLTRLRGFGEFGVPESWLGRWDNLSSFYLPRFDPLTVLVGVAPNPVLAAPETWREVIYLEAGYLQFLWIGGIPLLLTFGWLSVAVLRRTAELMDLPGVLGATGSALRIAWVFLLVLTVLDPHLTMRGIGDLLFALLAITTGRLSAARLGVARGT